MNLRLPTLPSLAAVTLAAAATVAAMPAHAAADDHAPATRPAAAEGLIPRATFFGNPDRAAVRVSPDGQRIGFVAPLDGVLNVFVGPLDDPDAAEPITFDTGRGITSWFFAFDNEHVIYAQDVGGDENNTIFAVNLDSGDTKPLTPNAEVEDVADAVKTEGRVAGQIGSVDYRVPGTIVVGINDRNPQFHDLYTVDLATGERTLLAENPGVTEKGIPGGFATDVIDGAYVVRHFFTVTNEGGLKAFDYADGEVGDEVVIDVPADDILTTSPAGYTKDGKGVFLLDSRGRDTAALFVLDLETGEQKLLAENDKADIAGIEMHPTDETPEAVSFNYLRNEYKVLDDEFGTNLAAIREKLGDAVEIDITSRSMDDQTWIVAEVPSDGPVRYHRFDNGTDELAYLFSNRSELEGLALNPMHPVVIESRDGLDLVSYLTVPGDADGDTVPDAGPVPMVLYVHGGPWARDEFGYNPAHQWLSNRGYAVLSVNYRGSTGFGKTFTNAGNREWAGKMHDDLIDAVDWAVERGIADPDKVAIMGGSYGGYASLVGVTFTPDKFAAGVSIVGPSNLVTLMNTIPPYWVAGRKLWQTRLGDVDTEEGRAFLMSRSPITKVDQIQAPLLIGQGGNDPRVKQAESDQIVEAMNDKGIPVTYVLYPDEGHGFARPENRLSFFGISEAFLAEHLGGDYEPLTEGDVEGSSLEVPAGAGDIAGLPDLLD